MATGAIPSFAVPAISAGGIDIRGGIDATFGPSDDVKEVTDENMNGVKDVIAQRLVAQNITDYELYSDTANRQVIVRISLERGRAGL